MGWKSTITITRGQAIASISTLVNQVENDKLEDLLEELVDATPMGNVPVGLFGHNYTIVDDGHRRHCSCEHCESLKTY